MSFWRFFSPLISRPFATLRQKNRLNPTKIWYFQISTDSSACDREKSTNHTQFLAFFSALMSRSAATANPKKSLKPNKNLIFLVQLTIMRNWPSMISFWRVLVLKIRARTRPCVQKYRLNTIWIWCIETATDSSAFGHEKSTTHDKFQTFFSPLISRPFAAANPKKSFKHH